MARTTIRGLSLPLPRMKPPMITSSPVPTKPRALELLGEAARKVVGPSGLPLVGRVAAGSPILAEENVEDYVDVPGIAGGESGEYVLRVNGDSMKGTAKLEKIGEGPLSGDRTDHF